MRFLGKKLDAPVTPTPTSRKAQGDVAEDRVLQFLQAQGLSLLQRNYRTPGRGGGEIDLVMRESDGTIVFVEVRQRSNAAHGGAAASVSATKQARIVFAARHYLVRRAGAPPPCRFDVVAMEQGQLQWFKAAFDAQ